MPSGMRDHQRDDEAGQPERQRDRQPLPDQAGDRRVVEIRAAEIALRPRAPPSRRTAPAAAGPAHSSCGWSRCPARWRSGPAMEIARSPDSRVSAKLITSTVRQTSRRAPPGAPENAAWRSLLCANDQSQGSQPGGASSNPSNENAGATMQLHSVQRPRLSADCQRCRGHKLLQLFAAPRAGPSRHSASAPIAQQQWRTRLPEPQLGRIDAVPVAALALAQQEQDRGAGAARPISAAHRAKSRGSGRLRDAASVPAPRSPPPPKPRHRADRSTGSFGDRVGDAGVLRERLIPGGKLRMRLAATAARRSGNPDSPARRRP